MPHKARTRASNGLQRCVQCGAILGKEFCKPDCTCEECSKWDRYVNHLDDLMHNRNQEKS